MVKQQVESQVRAFQPTHLPARLPAYCATYAPTAICVRRSRVRCSSRTCPQRTAPRLPAPPPSTHSHFCFPAHAVRDLSHTSVSISPADYSNWHDVRTELMSEAKVGFKARVETELAAANGQNLDDLKIAFQKEEREIEHAIDHKVHTFSASVDVSYNFLSH